MSVVYARETSLGVEDYVGVLAETLMRNKRPLANTVRIGAMLAGANFVVTARDEAGQLLGLARCITDFSWICYCAELAVREGEQGRGIGTGILDCCRQLLGPGVSLLLISEPWAVGFYERAGLERLPDAFVGTRTDRS